MDLECALREKEGMRRRAIFHQWYVEARCERDTYEPNCVGNEENKYY